MYHYRLLSLLSTSVFLISFQALAVSVDFETPILDPLEDWRIINPYDIIPEVTFSTPTDEVLGKGVGLVKNKATSACVTSSTDADQKLGTGTSLSVPPIPIGSASLPIWATFSQPLVPPVSVSVQFQSEDGVSARLRFFDSTDTLITEVTDTISPNGGLCSGLTGNDRGSVTLLLGSDQPVAYAVMDIVSTAADQAFVIDNFEVQSGIPFPDAGVDNTPSLGKFSIRLTQEMGEQLLGINNCPDDPACLIESPLLADPNTQIGRSGPHLDGDNTDINGAQICEDETNSECNTYLTETVADSDFIQVPSSDGNPFDEGPSGTQEVHTQILHLNMTDTGQCGSNTANAVRAGLAFNLPRSIGEVESLDKTTTNSFPAESFFNMFVEVDIDLTSLGFGIKTVFNKEPLVIQNDNVNGFPPNVIYIHGDSGSFTPLVYDQDTDKPVGWIVIAGHGIGYEKCNEISSAQFETAYAEIQESQQLEPVLACEPSEPATYSNETREAIIPCLEMPLYTDIDGQPVEVASGLYSATLEIPFGFSDFRVKELLLLREIATSNPDNATFDPESGILYVPLVKVPTITPYLSPVIISGPILDCSVELQQSVLRPEVFSLIAGSFFCSLPN